MRKNIYMVNWNQFIIQLLNSTYNHLIHLLKTDIYNFMINVYNMINVLLCFGVYYLLFATDVYRCR